MNKIEFLKLNAQYTILIKKLSKWFNLEGIIYPQTSKLLEINSSS